MADSKNSTDVEHNRLSKNKFKRGSLKKLLYVLQNWKILSH